MDAVPRDRFSHHYHVYIDGSLRGVMCAYAFPLTTGLETVPVTRETIKAHYRAKYPDSHVVVL